MKEHKEFGCSLSLLRLRRSPPDQVRQMIVCSCTLMTDQEIRALLATPNAPRLARDVYAALGREPKCGGCAPTINRLIQAAKAIKEANEDKRLHAA